MIRRLWKPWYVWQPAQLARRVMRSTARADGFGLVRTSWGARIVVDRSKPLGMSIERTGVYDLTVSELLFRLIERGDVVVDAGANVGYMTVLAAIASGREGTVHSFEPHPGLFPVLRDNAASAARLSSARIALHEAALGNRSGAAELALPDALALNDGLAYVCADGAGRGVATRTIRMETLDTTVEGPIGVLKLDVEGFEAQVLEGAASALSSHRIRHVVFEDHQGPTSPAMRLLLDAGYRLYALGWSVWGPRVLPFDGGRVTTDYEAPSYLASVDPEGALRACAPRGWQALRDQVRLKGLQSGNSLRP
jgi:FkbM family methyltransferase